VPVSVRETAIWRKPTHPPQPLAPKSLYPKSGHRRARILLLSRNQVAVANSVRFETTGHDEVRPSEFFRLVLDVKRLDALTHELVDVLFFGISKAGPGLALDQQLAVHLGLEKKARGMAENGGDLFPVLPFRRPTF